MAHDARNDPTRPGPAPGGARVDAALIRAALERLAGPSARAAPRPGHVDALIHAALSPDPRAVHDALALLRAEGLEAGVILGACIPAAARRLGDEWCADGLGFASVTIGAARLQALVRKLDAPARAAGRGPAFVVALPAGLHHTLGVSVVAAQLRRAGASVTLDLSATPSGLGARLARGRPDAVLVAAPLGTASTALRELISAADRAAPGCPVLIGGAGSDARLAAEVGATGVAPDATEVLRTCGADAGSTAAPSPGGRVRA
ncbi:MAG: cobalamin B12-binding domain-containing protein [Paracoccaceae bacterium]